jgi:YD repeat-containing protein
VLALYDWENMELMRRIDIEAKALHWSESGHLLAIVTDDAYYILKYDAQAAATGERTPDGIESAFDVSSNTSIPSVFPNVKDLFMRVKNSDSYLKNLYIATMFCSTNSVKANKHKYGEIA